VSAPLVTIRRGFVVIAEGQVHFREAGAENPGMPLVMFHPSPTSSWILQPLIGRFGRARRVVAPDTLGNGDSCPPAQSSPEIAAFADAHLRALDALGIGRFDAYGSHTGGNIAAEVAIRAPDRVRALILDGMAVYGVDEQADLLANYAPEVPIDHHGSQLNWVWHFVRDNALFWPWYRRDAAHVRRVGLPPPSVLHDKVVEVLKAVRTYHLSYRAALAYDKRARLPLVLCPTLLACAEDDMLLEYLDAAAALMPAATRRVTPGTATPERAEETVAAMLAFLEAAAD
jgi:pimeloyl-ACP methyl ester carboxylesterase